MSDTSGNEQVRQVNRIFIHEDFGLYRVANDIALLSISEPFQINTFVAPISLPIQDQETIGNLTVSGWGRLGTDQRVPDTLQKVQVEIVSDATCKIFAPAVLPLPKNSTVCTGLYGGKSACNGDSGGPLRAVNGGYLAGIVSFGSSRLCGERYKPNVNTRVSHYVRWIEEQAGAA